MTQNLEPFLKKQGWDWALPLAKLAIRVGLAVVGSMLGAFLTFPGLRLAQTHRDALTMSEDRPMLQLRGSPGGWGGWGTWGRLGEWWGASPLPALTPQVPPAHQLPVSPVHPVALDKAHCTGLPATGALWRNTFLPAVRLGLRLDAPLGAGGPVLAAAGGDPAPPAGLPVPGQGPRGAAAEGGWPHRGPRDPAAGGPGLLLRDGGKLAVPHATHPHPQLHTTAQDTGWLLLGPGPCTPTVPRPVLSQRCPGRPRGGRSPADGSPHRRSPGRLAHASLSPRCPGLPCLVDGRLPAPLQSLRPLLSPTLGRLLAACRPSWGPEVWSWTGGTQASPLCVCPSVPSCKMGLGLPTVLYTAVPEPRPHLDFVCPPGNCLSWALRQEGLKPLSLKRLCRV
ncbi:transmembrane protein 161A isoform X2 [Eulemur rufifrons]|uniref:transmembrane protein 161A isoform X2 n=1 Tax=Eulemur rufifrons TaxID=859984 RepID=UPI0037430606